LNTSLLNHYLKQKICLSPGLTLLQGVTEKRLVQPAEAEPEDTSVWVTLPEADPFIREISVQRIPI